MGGLLKGVDEWEGRDDYSFMCRATLCVCECVWFMRLLYIYVPPNLPCFVRV